MRHAHVDDAQVVPVDLDVHRDGRVFESRVRGSRRPRLVAKEDPAEVPGVVDREVLLAEPKVARGLGRRAWRPLSSSTVHDLEPPVRGTGAAVSYTHLRAHETDSYLVCRLLLE